MVTSGKLLSSLAEYQKVWSKQIKVQGEEVEKMSSKDKSIPASIFYFLQVPGSSLFNTKCVPVYRLEILSWKLIKLFLVDRILKYTAQG